MNSEHTELRSERRIRASASSARGVSWLALVAETSAELRQVHRLRAEVRAELSSAREGEVYRLVVQAYPRSSLRSGQLSKYARPLASTQRAVTADVLRDGIRVDLLQPAADVSEAAPTIVFAWIEVGEPNLEFDALRARPSAGAAVGVSEVDWDRARLVLRAA